MRYYDEANNRLVYVSNEANQSHWDAHWDEQKSITSYSAKVPSFNMIVSISRKYLPQGSHILEGGAGLAQNSWHLHLAGYEVTALDFASETIEFLKKHRPEVNPILGDVRSLKMDSESVDGYWSLGVIEHFYDGYDEIVMEAHRVLKNGGFFFVTFPCMSKIRRVKAKLGRYPLWQEQKSDIRDFYQFALYEKTVIDAICNRGFHLCDSHSFDGVKGFKDEVSLVRKFFQRIYDGQGLIPRIIRKSLDAGLRGFAGHSRLLIFQKVK